MRWILLCVFLICLTDGFGQDNKDSVRDVYIKRYSDYFALWPVLKKRSLTFQIARNDDRSERVDFIPNNSYSVGVGAYLFDLAFELAFAVPVNEKSYSIYGKSDALDLQLNALGREWGGDIYYQKYQGFYADDPSIDYVSGQAYPQRRDIESRNFGLNAFYIVNESKFSFQSAYTFAERQLRRGGSFLVSGAINSFKLTADSAVLSLRYRNEYGEAAAFEDLRYVTLSIMPGYAYNLVYRNFFINAALMVGPGHNWITYKNQNQSEKNDITFNSLVSVRIGVGYNGDRFFAGINFTSQSRNVDFGNIYFTNTSDGFRILAGYRFKEFGVLRRSVWEIPRKVLGIGAVDIGQ